MSKPSNILSTKFTKTVIATLMLSVALPAAAQEIPYTASSTNLPPASSFPITEMNDGITADNTPGFNGFVSRRTSGSIEFTLPGSYTLSGMKLWNDVNVRREGVKDFTLTFYSGGSQVGTFSASAPPVGQVPEQDYIFSASNVDKVVMNATARDGFGIEIRELKFFGTPKSKPTDFACYDLMAHERETYRKEIDLVDQFGKSRSVVGHAVSICNPAGVNDRKFNPKREKDHLVCYEIVDQKTERRTEHRVKIGNKLETNMLVTGGIDELCMVSTKEHIRTKPRPVKDQPRQKR